MGRVVIQNTDKLISLLEEDKRPLGNPAKQMLWEYYTGIMIYFLSVGEINEESCLEGIAGSGSSDFLGWVGIPN